ASGVLAGLHEDAGPRLRGEEGFAQADAVPHPDRPRPVGVARDPRRTDHDEAEDADDDRRSERTAPPRAGGAHPSTTRMPSTSVRSPSTPVSVPGCVRIT